MIKLDLPIFDDHFDKLAEWWNLESDYSLIIGVYKHGFGNWKEMKSDKGLSFITSKTFPEQHREQKQEIEKDANDDAAVRDNDVSRPEIATQNKGNTKDTRDR